jgi:hypothetical protein
MKRKKIDEETEAEVMFKSNRECCVCDKRGDHIHHIDGDHSHSSFDNLALLCFDCHDQATIKGSLKKKLSPKTIIKYRNHKYQVIATKRENSLKVFNSPIKDLTTEDLLTTTKNAVIIVEIEKIREKYFAANWDKRSDIICKLDKFSKHTNFRIAYDIYDFISIAAGQTRVGMSSDVASAIFSLTLDFFPNSDDESQNEKIIELSNQCINIAFDIVYDTTIHVKNYGITMYGLSILKYIYLKGKQQKIQVLIDNVNSIYNELERTLQRPERNDLANALELMKYFRADLEVATLAFPPLPDHLMKLIYSDKKI